MINNNNQQLKKEITQNKEKKKNAESHEQEITETELNLTRVLNITRQNTHHHTEINNALHNIIHQKKINSIDAFRCKKMF